MLALMRHRPELLTALATRVAGWYARRATGDLPRPLSCGVYLTNRCNLRCEMCNIFRHPDQGFLDATFYQKLVEGLGRVGCFYLSFAGGEPFLDPELATRVRLAKRGIPYVHVVTNGLSLTERRVHELVEAGLDEISVSVDGMEEDHDRIRGMAGAFTKTMAGIDTVMRLYPKMPLVVNSIISPSNLASLPALADLLASKNLMHKFQPVNEHPEFEGIQTKAVKHSWTAENVTRVREFLERVASRGNVVNSPYFLSKIPAYLSGKTEGGLFTAPCRYGTHHLEVTSDGRIFPCLTGMDWSRGFELETDLEALLASAPYREAVKRLEKCTGCQDNMYVCNFEPRIAFPVGNFLRYRVSALLEPMS
jgi:MoaA/NifB/PqqE/SkfB family radical SAM enzyme